MSQTKLAQHELEALEAAERKQRMRDLDAAEKAERQARIKASQAAKSPLNPNSPYNPDGTRKVEKVNPPIIIPPPTVKELADAQRPPMSKRFYDPVAATEPAYVKQLVSVPLAAPNAEDAAERERNAKNVKLVAERRKEQAERDSVYDPKLNRA